MSKTTILVTAAAGVTSNATARHLLDLADKSKFRIRVGARSDSKIQDLIKKGAEYVKLDYNDKLTMDNALKVSTFFNNNSFDTDEKDPQVI